MSSVLLSVRRTHGSPIRLVQPQMPGCRAIALYRPNSQANSAYESQSATTRPTEHVHQMLHSYAQNIWSRHSCSCATAVLPAWGDLPLDQLQSAATSVTLTMEQVHAASFRPTQSIFVAKRTCFDVKDGREAISIARHLLLNGPDLVAYACIATALGGSNKGGFTEINADVTRLFNRVDMHVCIHQIRYFLGPMHDCSGHSIARRGERGNVSEPLHLGGRLKDRSAGGEGATPGDPSIGVCFIIIGSKWPLGIICRGDVAPAVKCQPEEMQISAFGGIERYREAKGKDS